MKNIWQYSLIIVSIILSSQLSAQTDSSAWKTKPEINVLGFIDVFYVYDFNNPQGDQRQGFLFNHNRHNEFNVNLGLVKVGLNHAKYRANLALQTGTYVNDNLSAEPGLLKNIFEARIGLSLNKKNNLWLDAGIFPSHIGFESALSTDNLTLTRSIAAENSPYFLTGAKLSFAPSEKLEIVALIANGWQRIQGVSGNSLPSFGTQVYYTPSKKVGLNWSTFIGSEFPDIERRMRYFSNLYGQFDLSDKFSLIAGFDVGVQQQSKGSSNYDYWLTPTVIAQYAFTEKWKMALRAEYYQDENGVIISTGTTNGFQTTGVSLNLDYSPIPYIMCRLEGRWLNSRDNIFETTSSPTNNNFIVGASVAIKFDRTFK